MKELRGKSVLVTGAADGIGRGAALAFAREGSKLALVDIDAEKLERVAAETRRLGVECETYVVDVADAAAVQEMAASITERFGGVDVLANVAGVCVVSDVVEMSPEDFDWIVHVNLYGPFNTIRAFVPQMMERGSGHVVNVASAGGIIPFGLIGAYCMTKAGLIGLSGSLAQEVFDSGVRVTAFCPGVTRTSIVDRMRFTGYSQEKMLAFWDKIKQRMQSPERSGELIVDAVRREKPAVVTTIPGKVLVFVNKFVPGLIRLILTRGKHLNDRLYR